MGVRNPGRDELLRLEEKTLDAQFLTTIQQGLNCSPFESRSVLEVVKEVYFPFLAQAQTSALLPGKITLVGVCADEPAGKPIANARNELSVCYCTVAPKTIGCCSRRARIVSARRASLIFVKKP